LVCRLLEAGVEFIAVDLPTVNNLTIHILAAVPEAEARMTSARMKAALAAAKARGARLGSHVRPGTREQAFAANRAAAKVITAKAQRNAADMAPVIGLTRAEGATSLAAIAAALTARGVPSPSRRGGWLIRTTLNPRSGTNRRQHG
jgi:DNA invertase Pin-like site-specific DNA recombinase